ncbi:MAG: hypothetical protein JHC95_06740 [Solirubrobacteraceae bacterium]|nr:hypothetical protein [Solirubrobacteraceae bacterium]
MALFAWVMMGLAIWHFTVFVPDHFWGGIVGAFLGGMIGAVVTGYLFSGLQLPSQDETDVLTVLEAVPGALIGLGIVYAVGLSRDRKDPTFS